MAAVLVLFYHVNHSVFGTLNYWPNQPFGNFMSFAHAGVEFFFVLSGFIIFAAHRRNIGVPGRMAAFVWKRFRRVYPVYWIVLLAILPVYALVPTFGSGITTDFATLLNSFTLVHLRGTGEVLTVSWTLFHEIVFYAVFSLLLLHRAFGGLVLGVWLVCSAISAVSPSAVPAALAFYVSPIHLLFGMGMAAAWLVQRRRIPGPWALGLAGTALFLGTGTEDALGGHLAEMHLSLLYGVGSTLIVAAAIELERTGRLQAPPTLAFLGNASYSIYLVHFLALSVLAKLAKLTTAHVAVPHALIYALLVIGSTCAGIVFHLCIEAPVLAGLTRVRRRTPP